MAAKKAKGKLRNPHNNEVKYSVCDDVEDKCAGAREKTRMYAKEVWSL